MAAKSPQKITAAIPICGGGDPASAADLIDVPIWVFHGEADEAVDIEESRRMMAAVLAAGGKKIASQPTPASATTVGPRRTRIHKFTNGYCRND